MMLEVHNGGLRIAAQSHGEGPPVMLVHGLGFTSQLWRGQSEQLQAAGFRVISYDLRGFGSSELPPSPYEMEDLSADLDAVRTAAGCDAVHLVAHSMGGMVALRYAVDHPERVSSLFLVSTTAHNGRRASAFARVMSMLSERGFEETQRDPERWQQAVDTIADVIPFTGPVMDVLRKLTEKADPSRSLAWRAIASFTVKEKVSSLSCPTLVMHGDCDPNIPFAAGKLLHEAIVGSTWQPVEGAKHNLPIEHAELFSAQLLSFLRKVAL